MMQRKATQGQLHKHNITHSYDGATQILRYLGLSSTLTSQIQNQFGSILVQSGYLLLSFLYWSTL